MLKKIKLLSLFIFFAFAKVALAEGWAYTKVNNSNKRQVLVFPTELRIKFWSLYCKNKYRNEIENKLDKARDKLKEYDHFISKKNIFEKKTLKQN